MEKETFEQIQTKNDAAIGALSTYLDQTVPKEQFSSIATVRAQNIKPIQYQEDLVSNGLIGEDGLITQKGILHNELKDKGFLSHDGTLTEKATAFVMDEDEALRPENLNYWRIRKGNKIGERDVPWGETFESIGERVWDAVAGLGTMTGIGLQYLNQRDPDDVVRSMKNLDIPFDEDKTRSLLQEEKDKLMNRASVAAVSMVENSAKSFTEAGAIVNLAGAWALALPSKLLGDHKNATELVDTARQFQDRLRKSNKDAAIGSTLDAVFQTVQYVPEMARAKSELPKEEFDKLVKQPGATGELFVDPFGMAQVGTVMKLAMIPITSRVALNAERVLGKAAERVTRLSQIEVDLADLERARGLTQNSADIAKKTAEALRERYDLTGNQDLLRRANTAEDIFNGSSTKVAQFTNDGIRLSEEAAQLTAESQKLASRVPVAAAQKFEAAIKAGRDLKSVPFKTFASIIEPVGRGLVALDDGLDSVSKKLGIGAAYNLLTSKVGQAVGYGSAFGLGPVPALVGAAGSVLKSGPFLQRLADTSRIMGTEMAKAQSQMPFFQRVANNPMISPAHRSLAHLSDLATLGGFAPYVAKKAVKGTALSFPLDFAAEYMSEGGEVTPNTFKQAFAESLLIGGSSAALGGMFAGTQKRHRELSNNDESNFRNEITSPEQKQLFTNAPKFLRNAVGTFSAVFPSVNIELTQGGGGFHDDNTIGIDVNSSNPLKYLLAHEVKHLLVHRNQMHTPIVTMMLGDGETGGIMRAPDGSLNPEFDAFAKEYNSRQIASGREPVSLGKIAEEFFVEAGAEDMASMAESGELGAIASRTEARRMVGRLFNAALDKSTILKDFHLRIGGLMDQGGKLVSGNGLLSSGITQTPEMRNMTRNMLGRAAGRAVGQFEPLGAANVGGKGEGPGINLPITPTDKAMIEKIGPVEFEMETVNGVRQVARDSSGNPIPIDFNTQLMRSRTGSLVQEAIGNRPSSYQYSTGEMNLNDEGVWEGYLSPDLIEQIKRKGVLNQEQIRIIENVNSMVKNFKGDVALVINHPATSRNRKGKLNYKTLKATLRQVAPVSWSITKDGNLMLGLMSVTQLKSNVDNRIASSTGQKLYQGNRAKLMVDVGRVMELHNKGQRTDSYFDEQYGAAKSQQYKNFVNSVFGLISKKQNEANPIFSEENLRSGNGVYKTYRADRISQATKMTGDKYPFQYDFVVQNMMPNGLPTLDDQGRPVAQNRLPEQARQMPEPSTKSWNPNPIQATNKIAKEKGIPNKITNDVLNQLQGKPIVVGMADLLGAGGQVRGVDVTGGPGYPVQMFDPENPSEITAVWASQEQGIRGVLQNMEKTNSIWTDESGHHWAIYAPHTMSQVAHRSNAQTPQIYISKVNDMASQGALSKTSAIDISNHIREKVQSAKDMPDIGTSKLNKFIEDASFETRAAIMQELTTARSRSIGAPSPESVLAESRDIQYHGVEKNALTGLLLIDIDRMAKQDSSGKWSLREDLKASDFGVKSHPSYDTIMPGRVLAHFDNPVPFNVAAPEMIRTMREASPKSRPDYLLTKLPREKGIKFQPLTEDIANAINSAQDIAGNVPYIREVVKATNGNWRKFTGDSSLKGLTEFTNAIDRSPAKESLTQYDPKEVKRMVKNNELEIHQLGDNDIWFGVKKTKSGNDLVSVVNNTGIPGMLNVIMARALEAGVNTLDASSIITPKTPNGLLPTLYERYGWKEVGRDKFDRKYLVEKSKSDTKAQHEAKIAQKEAALKMFWKEQGWDGKSMPDIVYMKHEGKINGKQTSTVIDKRQESVFAEAIGSTRPTAKTTTSKIRGSRLSEGQEQGVVSGALTGASGASERVLPRGFDSVVETIRSASDVQLETIGLTKAEAKKFLDKFEK